MALKDLKSIYQEGIKSPSPLKNSKSPVNIIPFQKTGVTNLDSTLDDLVEFDKTNITELPRNSQFSKEVDTTPKSPLADIK